jgi:hypothetical protein
MNPQSKVISKLKNVKYEEFATHKWRNAGPSRRAEMVKDLLKKYTLIGMKRSEIIETLGGGDGECDGVDDVGYLLKFDGNFYVLCFSINKDKGGVKRVVNLEIREAFKEN